MPLVNACAFCTLVHAFIFGCGIVRASGFAQGKSIGCLFQHFVQPFMQVVVLWQYGQNCTGLWWIRRCRSESDRPADVDISVAVWFS